MKPPNARRSWLAAKGGDVSARLSTRVLGFALALAILAFGTQAVCHWHGIYHDEDHCSCQVCHVGHAAIPQAAARVEFRQSALHQSALPPARAFVASGFQLTPSIPRAPPV